MVDLHNHNKPHLLEEVEVVQEQLLVVLVDQVVVVVMDIRQVVTQVVQLIVLLEVRQGVQDGAHSLQVQLRIMVAVAVAVLKLPVLQLRLVVMVATEAMILLGHLLQLESLDPSLVDFLPVVEAVVHGQVLLPLLVIPVLVGVVKE